MELNDRDRALIDAVCTGLPLVPRPYAALAAALGMTEAEVLERLRHLCATGVIRRFGVVVRHWPLGYSANAMVVFDVPEPKLQPAAHRLAALPWVSLCYRRPRRLPLWPYNLYCMIHGRDRARVESLVLEAAKAAGLTGQPRAVLFSRRCFAQRGARYGLAGPASEPEAV